MSRWQRYVFDIADARRITGGMRICVALVVALWVWFGPFPSFYAEEETLLYRPTGLAALIPPLGPNGFMMLRLAVMLGCAGMLWGRFKRDATILAAISFGLLNGYVSGFSEVWNYNSHLNLFLAALCFAPPQRMDGISPPNAADGERCSAIIFFMRLQVAVIYLQAGLAKLVIGGLDWPAKAPLIHLGLQDNGIARWLMQFPDAVQMAGVLVVIVELSLPVLFLVPRTQKYAAVLAISLHTGFFLTLGIWFWHLWALYPVLFFFPTHHQERPANKPFAIPVLRGLAWYKGKGT